MLEVSPCERVELRGISGHKFVAALPEPDRQRTLERVREMLETHPELQGRERFPFPYDTDVFWCHRR